MLEVEPKAVVIRPTGKHTALDRGHTDGVTISSLTLTLEFHSTFNPSELRSWPVHAKNHRSVCLKARVDSRGATTFSKLGGSISWSVVLLPSPDKNLERYTQFGAVCYPTRPPTKKLSKKLGVSPIFVCLGRGVRTPHNLPVVAPMVDRQTDRQTDTTGRITFPANVVGK